MSKTVIISILESILTIDSKGRPAKARLLLSLMQEAPSEEFLQALKEISERDCL